MRMFTDDQLKDFSEPLCDKALSALRRGDLTRVRGLLHEMIDGPASLNALGMPIMTRFIDEWRRDFGEERTKELLERIGRNIMRTMIDDFRSGREKEVISDLLSIFRHQYRGAMVPISETADDIVYDLVPCGSGGNVSINASNGPGDTPWNDGLNSYCQYCKATQRAFNIALGYDAWTTDVSPDLPGRCTLRFIKFQTRGKKLFSPAELYDNARTRAQSALDKISLGDLGIEDLLKEQHRDWLPWHDFMCATIGYLFGTCYVEGGAAYLDEKLQAAYDTSFGVFYPYYHAMDDEQNVRSLCVLHTYHFMNFTVTEEDDRFAFRLDPCGSGGRLYRGEFWRDLFRYGGEISPLIREEHVIGFHRENFPVYCTHCASHNRDQFRRGNLWFVNDGHMQMLPGMPCMQYYYKKSKGIQTAQVDPKLREQVGM